MNDELVSAVAQIIRLGRGWDSSDVAREIIPLVLEHAERALNSVVVAQGKPECCGFGVGEYGSPPECCGNPDYMVSANAIAAAIRAGGAA